MWLQTNKGGKFSVYDSPTDGIRLITFSRFIETPLECIEVDSPHIDSFLGSTTRHLLR